MRAIDIVKLINQTFTRTFTTTKPSCHDGDNEDEEDGNDGKDKDDNSIGGDEDVHINPKTQRNANTPEINTHTPSQYDEHSPPQRHEHTKSN